jgi:endoglucanase
MHRREALRQLGAVTLGVAASPLLARAFGQQTPAVPGIYLNQVGYRPGEAKVATVANLPKGAAKSFRVVKGDEQVLAGTLSEAVTDAASGDVVAQADFSAVTSPGTYRVVVGELTSDPVVVAEDAYRKALYLATRMFYGQRCGCKVDLGEGYAHPVCHADGAFHATSGRGGKAKHLGGWHDAGDYGRYVVNSGISTSTLLYAYELYPGTLREFRLEIPRRHRHLPEILEEVRWNLDWMISLQDKDGGVWHKQTSEQFCAFILPQDDHLTSYVIGSGHAPFKTTAATADLAATAAIASRVYREFDRRYADHCLGVARRAWLWAVENPGEVFDNPPGIGTGGYGDSELGDEILWASGELFRVTGEPQFEEQLLAEFSPEAGRLRMSEPGWGNLFSLGCYAYAVAAGGDTGVKELIREAMAAEADRLVKASAVNGYGNTLGLREYGWGSNGTAGNQSFLLLLADRLKANPEARAVALNNLHYVLGRNCLGVSWVTQVGVRPFLHPHHRPSAADGIAAPWPGMVSGGPNRHPGDPAAKTLPEMPPMRMWLDDERAYSMNEIAINWNAPVVLLLAAANS